LEAAGLKIAIDERDFHPQATFLEEMERCIRESRFTLAILSSTYFESGNTQEEAIICKVLDMAERRRRLIPLTLEPAERPAWLYNIVGVDFTDSEALVEPFERLRAFLCPESPEGVEPTSSTKPHHPSLKEPRGELTRALEAAYQREEELLTQGGDSRSVKAEILDIRRQLREGGRLHAGDFLANGRFKLIEQLGRGGFATVWKAFDKRERTPVAIKVLHGQFVDDRTRLERFFRGARKMAELHHPGIVRVTERRMDDGGFHFFVMEHLEGGDLREAVLRGKVRSDRIVPLIQEVATALHYAHEKGVVHRDVKPANILIDGEGRPKLTDFDLVRAVDTTGGTMEGAMLGTYLYSAPEALIAAQEVKPLADVYSLAITTAFCFQGQDLPLDILRDTAGFLRRLPAPSGVLEVLAKAAAWDAEARFPSVRDFARALEEGLTAPVLPPATKPAQAEKLRVGDRPRQGNEGDPLEKRLLAALDETDEAERTRAVFRVVEGALPIDPGDTRELGLTSWALDYAPGRALTSAEREAARALRARLWQPFRELAPPPSVAADDRDWASIPGGRFEMGSKSGGDTDERPVHLVTLTPFRMLVHPVTNGEYRRFEPTHSGGDDLPVVGVDWFSAYAYCSWLGGRLPTEAEWEYAARAGCPHEYCDRHGKPTTLENVGWYSENSGLGLQPVETREPNPWGLFDMIGNVWEWVGDWYSPYPAASQTDPWGPPNGVRRVLRGGGFGNDAGIARAACRYDGGPGFVFRGRGFRVVLPAAPKLGS
jgi:formylglycine-generating enzyme required for sulfatase activity